MIKSREKSGLTAVLIAAVCAIVAAVYWPALSAKALSIDDQQYLTGNVLVQNPGWGATKRFLSEILEPSSVEGYYQPLSMISLMLDYAGGGRANNLRPFHVTSLALHTANTALIIVLLYMLFGNILAAAAVGLLFGVHPMTVEPIAWVASRKTLLATFFSLWSLLFYIRYSNGGGWRSYLGCFVMYLSALMSQPTSVPLPVVMLLMDYWPLKRLSAKTFLEKSPLLSLGVIFSVITYISQHRTSVAISPMEFGPGYIPLVLCHNIIFYLHKIVLPVNLSSYYAFPKPLGLSSPAVLGGVVGTCILIPILLISLRWTRAAFTGWLIFFAAIFPTMGVIGFTDVIAYDKYAYLPAIGLLMMATSFLVWLGKSNKIRTAAVVVVLILAGAEAVATQRYLVYWRDSMKLANHMLALAPDSALLYNNRGFVYSSKREYEPAICDFNKAIEINPGYYAAYYNRGSIYENKGELDRAISDYDNAIKLSPKYAEIYNDRGNIYYRKGELDRAISDFDKAIEINPKFVAVYNNRGNAYRDKGQYERAIDDYNKALEINPKHYAAYYNRGSIYASKGELDLALRDYNNALQINPRFSEAYNNRGNIYRRKGEYAPAIRDFEKALEINPRYAEAYFNKAVACETAGRKKEAVDAYKAFIKYAPIWSAQHVDHAKQRIKELER